MIAAELIEGPPDTAASSGVPAVVYYYDLDLARGVLMALGVVLHAANIYGAGIPDVVGNDARTWFFAYVDDVIHVFRMPAFFMISGYFCVMSLQKYRAAGFLRVRAKRLLVPFAATALTFNVVEHWVRARIAGVDAFSGLSLHDILLTNAFIYHLWFLPVLFVYSLAATAIFVVLEKTPRLAAAAGGVVAMLDRLPMLWLAPALALSAMTPHAAGLIWRPAVYSESLFGLKGFVLLEYAPYFAFGAFAYFARRNFENLRRITLIRAALFGAAILLTPFAAVNGNPHTPKEVWLSAIGSWIATLTIFGLFAAAVRRFAWRPKNVGDTTYTIYLGHHFLVTLAGAAFVGATLPIGVEFVVIVVAVAALTFAAHEYGVKKSPTLRFFFNGK